MYSALYFYYNRGSEYGEYVVTECNDRGECEIDYMSCYHRDIITI